MRFCGKLGIFEGFLREFCEKLREFCRILKIFHEFWAFWGFLKGILRPLRRFFKGNFVGKLEIYEGILWEFEGIL